jgi:hypothetical protein
MRLEVPHLTYSDIGKKAQEFLSQYHSSLELPIPIETIIDVQIGLNIVPFPNLYRDHRLSGYLSSDRTAIFVDEMQSDQYEEKYRYTLAHELGHYVLHKSCYDNLPFRSTDEYVNWRESITNEEISWFETHGDWFAGHVLVPTCHLETVCRKVIAKHQNTFAKFKKIPEDFWSYVSNEVATYFEVNPPVVEIWIKKENIPIKIQITD